MLISKNGLRRVFALVLAIIMILVLAAGCGNPLKKGVEDMVKGAISEAIDKGKEALADDKDDDSGYADEDEDDDDSYYDDEDDYDYDYGNNSYGSPASQLYNEFIEAKGNLASKLIDALSTQPELGLEILSFLGVTMVDLAAMPATVLGYGQGTVQAALNFFITSEVDYEENGNHYVVKYTNTEDEEIVFVADYDEAKEALIIDVTEDGKDYIHFDYRKTPYGYAGLVYNVTDNKVTEMYQISIHDNGGVIGMATDVSGKPGGLTGGESKNFPTACPQWYSIDGDQVTGVSSGGSKIDFKYVPPSD